MEKMGWKVKILDQMNIKLSLYYIIKPVYEHQQRGFTKSGKGAELSNVPQKTDYSWDPVQSNPIHPLGRPLNNSHTTTLTERTKKKSEHQCGES